jgi:hypothetical protein
MKTIPVTSFPNFVENVCSHLCDRKVFRGVSDFKKHQLVPVIGRLQKYASFSPAKLATEERYLLKKFRMEGARYVAETLDTWEWLVIARHHGLPTRLLDWTRTPLVALYFAVLDKADTTAAVYAEEFKRPVGVEKDPYKVGAVSKLVPTHRSDRIAAQSSVLTIHPNPRLAYTSTSLLCFTISPKLKAQIRQCLRRCGIHHASVFPGLDGVAANIAAGYIGHEQ